MLTPEQVKQIKAQLFSQLDQTNLPNKEEIKASIKEMNESELEDFLKQNNLLQNKGSPQIKSSAQQCIFCSIVSEEIPSNKIDENKDSIAILELNPASKAHTLIIPKKHISDSEKLPQTTFSLAKKISKKIKSKLKAQEILISSSNMFGHEIINVIPRYEEESLNKKHKATEEELFELKNLLDKKTKPKRIKPRKTKKIESKELWLPRRIP